MIYNLAVMNTFVELKHQCLTRVKKYEFVFRMIKATTLEQGLMTALVQGLEQGLMTALVQGLEQGLMTALVQGLQQGLVTALVQGPLRPVPLEQILLFHGKKELQG
jgi:tetrahydromethanopterin S-methyltransferase subunit F